MNRRRLVPVENETAYPTREIQKLVRWVLRELEIGADTGLLVRVKGHTGRYPYRGSFYAEPRGSRRYVWDEKSRDWRSIGPSVPSGTKRLIVCRIGRAEIYPAQHDRRLRGGPPPIVAHDWREAPSLSPRTRYRTSASSSTATPASEPGVRTIRRLSVNGPSIGYGGAGGSKTAERRHRVRRFALA